MAFGAALGSAMASAAGGAAAGGLGSNLENVISWSDPMSLTAKGLESVFGYKKKGFDYRQAVKYQKQLMDYQYGLTKAAAKEMPLASREGLISAGYNPLLAVGASAMSSGVGSPSASVPDSSGGVRASGRYNDFARMIYEKTRESAEKDIEIKNATLKNIKAQTSNVNAHTDKTEVDTYLGSALDVLNLGMNGWSAYQLGKKADDIREVVTTFDYDDKGKLRESVKSSSSSRPVRERGFGWNRIRQKLFNAGKIAIPLAIGSAGKAGALALPAYGGYQLINTKAGRRMGDVIHRKGILHLR